MLTLPPSTRVFIATRPADMRRSFDGLMAIVRDFLGEDPFAGHLFVFRNRTGDRLKILWWDRDGLAIFYKRLEEGCFTFPAAIRSRNMSLERRPVTSRSIGIAFSDSDESAAFQCLSKK